MTRLPLVGTKWTLVRLGTSALPQTRSDRRAWLVFAPTDGRVSGSGGCNRLMGGYRIDGPKLYFDKTASTRMACLDGMDHEDAFFAALGHVASWQIEGHGLQLLDAHGQQVATFEGSPNF